MIISDCHMHSSFSADSSASMESMILSSISKGLKTICFTEHMDYDYPPEIINGIPCRFEVDMPAYTDLLYELKHKYHTEIEILYGIELGMMPYLKELYADFLHQFDFDYVIMSSHLVHGKDPYYPEYFQDITEETGYRNYFQTIPENIQAFDDFDAYGHIDYVVRYGPNQNRNYTFEKYADILDMILKKIIDCGKALEVNTGSYAKGLHQPHPQSDVLKRYRALGGELITIGSDAHTPANIAGAYKECHDLLTSIGFKYYAVYKQRKPVMLQL